MRKKTFVHGLSFCASFIASLLILSSISAQTLNKRPRISSLAPAQGVGRQPSLPELYTMFLHYAVHVKKLSDDRAAKGKEIPLFRDHLQKASGLESNDYLSVLKSAERFVATTNEVDAEMSKVRNGKIYGHPNASLPLSQLVRHRVLIPNKEKTTDLEKLQVREKIKASRESLRQEIASIRLALGPEKTSKFEAYLTNDYTARRIGPQLFPKQQAATSLPFLVGIPSNAVSTSRVGNEGAVQAAILGNGVTLDSGTTCDDFDYVCADAQSFYTGSAGEVDLCAYAFIGGSALDDDEDGYIFIEEMDDYGYLSQNGGSPDLECDLPTDDVEADCDGIEPFAAPTSYTWQAEAYLFWEDEDGDEYAGQAASQYVDIGAPDIASISPNSLDIGTSGTTTIDGESLFSPFHNDPSVEVTNQATVFNANGFAIQGEDPEGGTISMSYSVRSDAATGPQTVTVNNGFGQGTSSITIPKPPPTITSVTVSGSGANSLIAGAASQIVTVTGQNLGSVAPDVLIESGSGVTIISGSVSAPTPQGQTNTTQTMTFQVVTAPLAPAELVSFMLQTNDGAPNPNVITPFLNVVPEQPSAPIVLDGTAASNNSTCSGDNIGLGFDSAQEVVIGQLIRFTACTAMSGVQFGIPFLASGSWTTPANYSTNAVGGYVVGAYNQPNAAWVDANGQTILVPGSASVTAAPLTGCQSNNNFCDFPAFYFVLPGTYNFTFTYNLGNGVTSAPTTVQYIVTGPSENANGLSIDYTSVGTTQIFAPGHLGVGAPGELTSGDTSSLATTGIAFQAVATSPQTVPGHYEFVQIITRRTTIRWGAAPCRPCQDPDVINELDNFYPYFLPGPNSPLVTSDTPAAGLQINLMNGNAVPLGETKDYFIATMYLMWDPALDASGNSTVTNAAPIGCAANNVFMNNNETILTPSTCIGSIPVPLQALQWGYCGDAINTLTQQPVISHGNNDGTNTWSLSCPVNGLNPITPTFIDSAGASSYPQWTVVLRNTGANMGADEEQVEGDDRHE